MKGRFGKAPLALPGPTGQCASAHSIHLLERPGKCGPHENLFSFLIKKETVALTEPHEVSDEQSSTTVSMDGSLGKRRHKIAQSPRKRYSIRIASNTLTWVSIRRQEHST